MGMLETRKRHRSAICLSKSAFVDMKNDWEHNDLDDFGGAVLAADILSLVVLGIYTPILAGFMAPATAFYAAITYFGFNKQQLAEEMQTIIDNMDSDEYVIIVKELESIFDTISEYRDNNPSSVRVLDVSMTVEPRGYTPEQLEAYVG